MVCTSPITLKHKPDMKFRCRKCLSCQITKRQEWAMRAVIESREHEANSFITLTFAPEYIPPSGVSVRDLQLFFKRLRKAIYPVKIKYLACGEYGEKLKRPHYHALIFGYDFPDKKYFGKTKRGELIYRSELLEKCWTYGISSVGALTHASASYVAGYIHKKYNNKKDLEWKHYTQEDTTIANKEFNLCSHGLAKAFYERNEEQLHNHNYIVYNGKKYGFFEYYNNLSRNSDKERYKIIKERRKKHIKEYTKDECIALDYVLKQKHSKKRSLEDEKKAYITQS